LAIQKLCAWWPLLPPDIVVGLCSTVLILGMMRQRYDAIYGIKEDMKPSPVVGGESGIPISKQGSTRYIREDLQKEERRHQHYQI
jgi:hypothetical protein